ncbi:phosphomannomutase [Halomicroarcula sp. GCM10025324]|uniref:phosphomannomutase n=1 Tax=Haloarcula TaxID=2237 RepID=UPI0023E7D594|nr:phosphomannomutase [Halomicroarcula sp. ZS-22-S1]
MDLFGTAGIRGPVDADVTPDRALAVGRAAGRDGGTFVVGYDGRVTSPALADAVASGLASAGANVVKLGRVPTPALAYASQGRRGVMVTASHNPPTDNGIKLFVDGEEYHGDAERRLEDRVANNTHPASWDQWRATEREDVLPDYRDTVATYAHTLGAAPTDLTVAVDCGNGMAGVATPYVLRALGASVIATEANVDGHFPARESKPTAESLTALRSLVASTDVDVGIGHDGDGDRLVLVDEEGDVVHEDTVVAMLAETYTARSSAEDPVVVTTPNASGRIDQRVEEAGGRVERVRLGALHEGIADVRADAGPDTEVVFAAEPWKHVHPAFGGWIDAVASAAVLARLFAATPLAERRAVVDERPYRKVSVPCPEAAKAGAMETLGESLPAAFPEATVSTDHGVRLSFDGGAWALVRPSGTEPYVRVYAESESVDDLIDQVESLVRSAVDDAN